MRVAYPAGAGRHSGRDDDFKEQRPKVKVVKTVWEQLGEKKKQWPTVKSDYF